MALTLSEEQRRALLSAGDNEPIEVIDPVAHVSYVLVRSDHFARVAAQADPRLQNDDDSLYLLAGID